MRNGWIIALTLSISPFASAQFNPDSTAHSHGPASASAATAVDDMPGWQGCAHAKLQAYAAGQDDPGAGPADGGIADFSTDTDVQHYFLDAEIFPTTGVLTGVCVMTVQSKVNGLSTFRVRIRDNFTLTSVQVDSVNAAWTRIDIPTIEITLSPTKSLDQVFTVRVAYTGSPVPRGFGSINYTTQNGQNFVFTLSEPFYAYTWWPAKDDNMDKATGEQWYTVPNTMKVASNGVLQGTDVIAGNKLRYRWLTNYNQAVYLFSFAATNYNKYTQTYNYGSGTMPVDIYIYPADDTAGNRNAWFQSVQMLATFAPLYGLYPFINEKYGIYEFAFGGGMEHQTMTGQGTFSESVTAHELAHQWWGDMVTCGTWSDIWLNEGFATYGEALWLEYKPGSSGTPALLSAMSSRRPSDVSGSVYCYDSGNINSIFSTDNSYRKGGWVLHMLRHVLGDNGFFQMLANYRANFEFGSAITDDLRSEAEVVFGGDMSWFFDQWVYDVGAPAYLYNWTQSTTNGRNFVELYVNQNQSGTYPRFTMPIDIRTTISAVNTTNVVWNDVDNEHLLFEVSGTVSALAFDPNQYILWTSAATTAFVQGPPKVTETSPAPGSTTDTSLVPSVTIWFHKTVNTSAGHYTLVGDTVGAVAVTFAYNAGTKSVTLTPTSPLAADTYTLTIDDLITDTASGKRLDGEVSDPLNPAALPSGDGLALGDAVVRFTVTAPPTCDPCDTNCDGSVNPFDIQDFLDLLGASPTPCSPCAGDADGNGTVNPFDINAFLECL